MAVDKEALLAAVAQAGNQGRIDYEQAQAANQAAQQEAIRQALANSVASQAPAGAQAEIAQIISRPYEASQTRLNEQHFASQDWYNRTRTNADQFLTAQQGLAEALTARALAEAQARGSGGGGSGGGDGGSDAVIDWYDNLKDVFGTADIAKGAIAAEAQNLGLHKWSVSGKAPFEVDREYAMDEYGVPAGVAGTWFTQPKDEAKFQSAIPGVIAGIKNKKGAKKAIRQARSQAKALPGNQHYLVSMVRQQAKAKVQRRRRRRR